MSPLVYFAFVFLFLSFVLLPSCSSTQPRCRMDFDSDGSPLNLDARANPFQPRAVQRSVSLPFALSPRSSSTPETLHRLIASEDIPRVDPSRVSIPPQPCCLACLFSGSGHDAGHNVFRYSITSKALPLTTHIGPTSRQWKWRTESSTSI